MSFLDLAAVAPFVESGHIVARRHPNEELTIYNYGDKTQIERVWNPITRMCRGLIVDDSGRIHARPYAKFFNVGEPECVVPTSFRVLDKADGSLGITYRLPSTGEIAISTRGSFESEQAIHATKIWRERYSHVEIPEGETWLFEIIYPENRIVLDYAGLDDLVFHGAIEIATGADIEAAWPGRRVESFPAVAPEALPVRANAEGYVLVEHPAPRDRPAHRGKIKFADYKRLHKLIEGITPHRIWACLSAGQTVEEIYAGLPDEFFAEVTKIAGDLLVQVGLDLENARRRWDRIKQTIGVDNPTRKDYALRIKEEPEEIRALLFALLSDQPLAPLAWKRAEP